MSGVRDAGRPTFPSRPRLAALALAVALGCGLREADDFLLGRPCAIDRDDCEEHARCLPHALIDGDRFDAYYCRSADSFRASYPEELPIAYCDPDRGVTCPPSIACAPDRFRVDVGPRPLVCVVD